jgi:hypothetical protein
MTEPPTYRRPANTLTDREIATEIDWLNVQLDELFDAMEESGGRSGSPGEWITERLGELEAEVERRLEVSD